MVPFGRREANRTDTRAENVSTLAPEKVLQVENERRWMQGKQQAC